MDTEADVLDEHDKYTNMPACSDSSRDHVFRPVSGCQGHNNHPKTVTWKLQHPQLLQSGLLSSYKWNHNPYFK